MTSRPLGICRWSSKGCFMSLIGGGMSGIKRLTVATLIAASVMELFVGGPSQVKAAMTQAPTLNSPPSASILATYGPSLQWTLPPGSTQYQLQVVPFGNDGPGVNII